MDVLRCDDVTEGPGPMRRPWDAASWFSSCWCGCVSSESDFVVKCHSIYRTPSPAPPHSKSDGLVLQIIPGFIAGHGILDKVESEWGVVLARAS